MYAALEVLAVDADPRCLACRMRLRQPAFGRVSPAPFGDAFGLLLTQYQQKRSFKDTAFRLFGSRCCNQEDLMSAPERLSLCNGICLQASQLCAKPHAARCDLEMQIACCCDTELQFGAHRLHFVHYGLRSSITSWCCQVSSPMHTTWADASGEHALHGKIQCIPAVEAVLASDPGTSCIGRSLLLQSQQ